MGCAEEGRGSEGEEEGEAYVTCQSRRDSTEVEVGGDREVEIGRLHDGEERT